MKNLILTAVALFIGCTQTPVFQKQEVIAEVRKSLYTEDNRYTIVTKGNCSVERASILVYTNENYGKGKNLGDGVVVITAFISAGKEYKVQYSSVVEYSKAINDKTLVYTCDGITSSISDFEILFRTVEAVVIAAVYNLPEGNEVISSQVYTVGKRMNGRKYGVPLKNFWK